MELDVLGLESLSVWQLSLVRYGMAVNSSRGSLGLAQAHRPVCKLQVFSPQRHGAECVVRDSTVGGRTPTREHLTQQAPHKKQFVVCPVKTRVEHGSAESPR